MRIIITMFIVCLVIGVVPLFAGGEGEGEPIKIGVAGVHSGDLASFGLPTVNAVELVLEKVKDSLPREVQLVIEDDQCKPELASNVATKLISEGVVAVIGHICSGATRTAMGAYFESEIVAISPSATNPALTKSGEFPNFFRTIAPDDAQARLQVDFVLDSLNLRRFVILHDNADYGKGLAEFAMNFLSDDGRADVAFMDGVTPGALDYSAIINRVGAADVDAVIFGGYHPEASKLVSQLRDQNIDVTFISGDGVRDDVFINIAGEAAEGAYATGPVDTSASVAAQDAIKEHRSRYGEEPGNFFLNAYAAAEALFQVIASVDEIDYASIRSRLISDRFDTPLGTIGFDERGDAIGVGFSVFQVQNGSYEEL